MMIPLVLGAAVVAYFVAKPAATPKVLNAAHEEVFRYAVTTPPENPAALAELATAFADQGYTEQARILEARARLPELPPEKIQAYAEVRDMAMQSDNPVAIQKVSQAFKAIGAATTAATLENQAVAVAAAQGVAEQPKADTTIRLPGMPKPDVQKVAQAVKAGVITQMQAEKALVATQVSAALIKQPIAMKMFNPKPTMVQQTATRKAETKDRGPKGKLL